MIFEILYEAAQKNELILIDGGFCRFHIDKVQKILTIDEIISTKPGAGSSLLCHLESMNIKSIVAECPADLRANKWYIRKGFRLVTSRTIKSGRKLNLYVKVINGTLASNNEPK
jgi:hypothetical protein